MGFFSLEMAAEIHSKWANIGETRLWSVLYWYGQNDCGPCVQFMIVIRGIRRVCRSPKFLRQTGMPFPEIPKTDSHFREKS
jgi:hypothetical protein